MKITRTSDKVLFWTNSGIKTFSQECNIFPHPRNERGILISEAGTAQAEAVSFSVNFDEIENYAGTPFAAAGRDEMTEILAKRYFNKNYKTDATRFMDSVGDRTGIKNFIGNYANSPVKAIIRPNGRTMYVSRLLVFIADSGSVDAGKYGNNITLNKGLFLKVENENGDLIKDLTDGVPVKTNADYGKFGFQVSDISFGSGLNYLHISLTFSKNGANLFLNPGQQLAVYFEDNFTGLTSHTVRAGAYYLE